MQAILDHSWTDALLAGQREARRMGLCAYGTEHALLGLLSDELFSTTAVLMDAEPALSRDRIRAALREAADDAPALAILGITAEQMRALPVPDPDAATTTRVTAHTAEFQEALNTATRKYHHLYKSGSVSAQVPLSATLLWLVVLEAGTRSARLLEAVGADPTTLRARVLRQMTLDPATTVAWPADVPRGPLARWEDRFWQLVNVESGGRKTVGAGIAAAAVAAMVAFAVYRAKKAGGL